MKYAGNITIVDDQGNTVFERELSADEMVEVLLKKDEVTEADLDAALEGVEGGVETAPAPAKRQYKKREKQTEPKKLHSTRGGEGKTCCGSKGRHFKWCKEAGGSGNPKDALPKPAHDHGRILSEEEWETCRDMHDQGKNTMMIRNELGEDATFQQINWAMLIKTYDGYVAHAKLAK